MNPEYAHKKFIFNPNIDAGFLFNLYEDDYTYIREVFRTTLDCFDQDVDQISQSYHSGDIQSLQKAVHKMKPVFGFTGLLSHQGRISEFEKKILMRTGTDGLAADFRALMLVLSEGKAIMEQEQQRLHDLISPA